jgi:hypothetical protein
VSGKSTLDLPTLAKESVKETSFHLSTVATLGRLFSSPGIQRNHRLADAQHFSTQLVVVFTIIGGIGQEAIVMNDLSTLEHGGDEFRRVVAGAPADPAGGKQVSVRLAHDGELGPGIS